MLYAHGPDLCRESDLRHAMANCFEALIGNMFAFVCAGRHILYLSVCHDGCDRGDVDLLSSAVGIGNSKSSCIIFVPSPLLHISHVYKHNEGVI